MPKYSRSDDRQYLSTVDIADVTGKEHKHIMRDARSLMAKHGIELLEKYKGIHLDSYKRKQAVLLLDGQMIKLLIQHYERRSPHVSNLISDLQDQRKTAYAKKIDALVDSFFNKWQSPG